MSLRLLSDLTVYFRLLSLNDGPTTAISRAVNSPQRSRLLPTQPWKVHRSGRTENAMSVTYKKAAGQRRGNMRVPPEWTILWTAGTGLV